MVSGFGDVDVLAADPLYCNCCHEYRYHTPECILCHCGGFVTWGAE